MRCGGGYCTIGLFLSHHGVVLGMMGGYRTSFRLLWIILLVYFVSFGFSKETKEAISEDREMPPLPSLPPIFECNCQCRSLDPVPQSSTKLIYLITVHNFRTIEDAAFLFRAIRSPNNIILIHVDKKCDWNVYLNSTLYQEVEACPCGSDVVVESVHSAKWSTWSMNDPTFWGMELASTRFRRQWDAFLNLSGDCMPVYTTEAMAKLFDPNNGPLRKTNFVTSSSCETGLLPSNVYIFPEHWHKRKHYTNDPKGDPIITYVNDDGKNETIRLITHFGSQWMALQPDFVDYLITSLKRPDSLLSRYKDELIRTKRLMTDETFIPTLLMHVHPFNETLPVVNKDGSLKALPTMHSIRYERMDEHVPTAFGAYPTEQRYEVPESSIADEPKVWGPYFLGVYDLGNLKDSGALFVRKVSTFLDPNIVHLLPVDHVDELPNIRWPKEVKLSPLPDWEKRIQELIEKKRKEKEHHQDGDKPK